MTEKIGLLYAEIAYNAATKSVYLPANSMIFNITVMVMTNFNDSGTDLLTVGTTTDPDRFVDDLDIAAAGLKSVTLLNSGEVASTTVPTQIDLAYTGQNSNATTGLARIAIQYVQK